MNLISFSKLKNKKQGPVSDNHSLIVRKKCDEKAEIECEKTILRYSNLAYFQYQNEGKLKMTMLIINIAPFNDYLTGNNGRYLKARPFTNNAPLYRTWCGLMTMPPLELARPASVKKHKFKITIYERSLRGYLKKQVMNSLF